MPVSFGVQCQPDGLQFQFPVTVTIPHCGVLASVDKVTPVLYHGKGVIGKTKYVVCLFFVAGNKIKIKYNGIVPN